MARTLQNEIRWYARAHVSMMVLALSAALMFCLTWYVPGTRYLASLRTQIRAAQARLEANQRQLGNLPALQADVYRLQAKLEHNKKAVPAQADYGTFIRDVSNLRQQCALRKCTWNPAPVRRLEGLSELPINMNVEGDFFAVFSFLRQVEDLPRLSRVRNVTIKTEDARLGTVQVDLAMNIYYADN